MAAFMRPFESQVYAAFRIVTGLLFLWHGAEKLFGGVLVMIGLFTSWAAFICSGQMAVAYWLGHGLGLNGPFSIFPVVNKGELAILYCFAFLFISARGAGIWSVDGSRSS